MIATSFDEPFPPVPDQAARDKLAREALEKLWGGDRNNIPGYKKLDTGPYCLYGLVSIDKQTIGHTNTSAVPLQGKLVNPRNTANVERIRRQCGL